jgi:hypothetical protein
VEKHSQNAKKDKRIGQTILLGNNQISSYLDDNHCFSIMVPTGNFKGSTK